MGRRYQLDARPSVAWELRKKCREVKSDSRLGDTLRCGENVAFGQVQGIE
jgi:hypothetical protein